MSTILVTGGAGFIGIHMSAQLLAAGHQVVVVDNKRPSYCQSLPEAVFVNTDLNNYERLHALFTQYHFDAVMHFAAFIEVGESVLDPQKYYTNNVSNALQLLNLMHQFSVKHFIFSSTAAIYGEPQYTPIDITHPKAPINPYGKSKWMIEQVLADYAHAYPFTYASLRYFNAAGADPQGRFGECHQPESHLIPLVLQTASGKRDSITIYGDDYDTSDGSCVRDYVHVNDLCQAHLLALQALQAGKNSMQYNLGNGEGFSVKQVIAIAQEVTARPIKVVHGSRRAGDPARLVADASLAKQQLGWQPQYSDLRTIIEHAWQWEQSC